MTRWVHYGGAPLGALHTIEQHPLGDYITAHEKPRGLWLSDEDDHGWRAWCESEGFACGRYTVEQEITFRLDANVLRLSHPEDLLEFTRRWGVPDTYSRRYEPLADISRFGAAHAIDWVRVAEEWDGILITPYQWSLRMETITSWYYGWDVASGCIWNPRCIAQVGEPQEVTFEDNDPYGNLEETNDEPLPEVQPSQTEASD